MAHVCHKLVFIPNFLKKPKMSRVTPGAWIIQRHTSEIIEGEIFQFKMNLKICFNL